MELTADECRELLSTHGVGRVAVTTADGLAIIPVNYLVVDDVVAYRTSPDSVPSAAANLEVAFEVDHIDDALSQGWSALAVGPARAVTDPEAVRRLEEQAYTTPWARRPRRPRRRGWPISHHPAVSSPSSPTESRSWVKASRRAISAIGGIHHPAERLSGVIDFDRVEVYFYSRVCRFGKY